METVSKDLLLAYPAADAARCDGLARLVREATVRVAVDTEYAANALAAAAAAAGTRIGISDLDGGFGTEQTPGGLTTIADLQKLSHLLADRGYDDANIDQIFHGNWLRLFAEHLPEHEAPRHE